MKLARDIFSVFIFRIARAFPRCRRSSSEEDAEIRDAPYVIALCHETQLCLTNTLSDQIIQFAKLASARRRRTVKQVSHAIFSDLK